MQIFSLFRKCGFLTVVLTLLFLLHSFCSLHPSLHSAATVGDSQNRSRRGNGETKGSCLASRRQDGQAERLVHVYLERMGTRLDRKHRRKAGGKVSQELFDPSVMEKYGFVEASRSHEQNDKPGLALYGDATSLKHPSKILDDETRKVIFLFRSDVSVTWLDPPEMLHHPNLAAIFKEYTIRNESLLTLRKDMMESFGGKYHFGVWCTSPRFYNSSACATNRRNPKLKFSLSVVADQIRSGRIRTVNWNFLQYYEMEPLAASFRNSSHAAQASLQRERIFHVFCAVHLRGELTSPTEMHKATILVALSKYSGPKKVHGCVFMRCNDGDSQDACSRKTWDRIHLFQEHFGAGNDTINHQCFKPHEYNAGMSQAKAVVCPWGYGERTGCDVRTLLLGSVLLKPWMDWVLAYPDIYQSGRYYVGFQPDASDLNQRIHSIVNDYDDYASMRRIAQGFCIDHVNATGFVDHFWSEACKAYTMSVGPNVLLHAG